MVLANPLVDYVLDLRSLRQIYTSVAPQARLNVIRQRLDNSERGPARLITTVSAVEALARSLVLHKRAKTKADLSKLYGSLKKREADSLVEEYLRLSRIDKPIDYYCDDTWRLFKYAVSYRNLVIHECTFLGQDKYPSLIQATEEVLDSLVNLGRLRRRPT